MASTELPPDINKGPEVLGACTTVTLAALILVGARMYVRVRMVKNVGLDDYTIVIAMVLNLVILALIWAGVFHGTGRHGIYIDPKVLREGLKLNLINQPFVSISLGLVKVSICLSFLRFAPTRTWRYFITGLMVFIVAYTLMGFFTILLQCIPLHVLWTPTAKAKCMKPATLWGLIYFVIVINIVTDVILAIIPAPIFWSLQIHRRTKVALTAVMGLGIFACAAAIVKTVYLPSYGKKGDFLWDTVTLTIWAVVECNIGIVAASIPATKPLFKAFRDRYGPGSRMGHTNSSYPPRKSGYICEISGHSLSVVTHDGHFVKTTPARSDGDSEDGILGLQQMPGESGQHRRGGISKTMAVEVTSSDRATDDGKTKWDLRDDA